MPAEKKARCNMYLNKKNVETVKRFIKGTGLNLSSYIDLFIGMAAKNIEMFEEEFGGSITNEKRGEAAVDIYMAYEVLGIFGMGGITLTPSQIKAIEKGKMSLDLDREENIGSSGISVPDG